MAYKKYKQIETAPSISITSSSKFELLRQDF
jgi:hypothetical protein